MAKLEKAKITVIDGALKGTVHEVLFNPTEYSLDRTNAYKATAVPGLGSPLLQFINGETATLNLELFLDDYTDPAARQTGAAKKSVKERIDDLTKLMDIDSKIHAPSPVRFQWGPLLFVGVIDKLARKVSLFQGDGKPARARLTVSFKEYRTLADQLQQPRRESADKSKRRVVIGQDSLWALAQREYNDARQWRLIAQANDLDDPLDISPGQWLILPPLENSNGTR